MQQAVLQDTIDAYQKNLQLTIEPLQRRRRVEERCYPGANPACGRARPRARILHIARAQYEHAIAVLTGQPPSSLEIASSKIDAPPPPIPLAVPSQLLERRPDIAANERQVAAANANVGIAETAYYPTLTLSASAGLLSARIWRICSPTPAAVGPPAPRSRRRCSISAAAAPQVEDARAAYDATVAAYRQTVLSAFQEVEDDLATLRYLAEEAVQQQEAVVAAQESLISKSTGIRRERIPI